MITAVAQPTDDSSTLEPMSVERFGTSRFEPEMNAVEKSPRPPHRISQPSADPITMNDSSGCNWESPEVATVLRAAREAWPAIDSLPFKVVVAVSGGPDSIALLRTLRHWIPDRDRLIVAHYHHGIRGTEADGDMEFVRDLALQLDCPLEAERAPEDAFLKSPEGWEEQARRCRYAFLERVACRQGARFVATGHTADDQAETILFRVLRGTGAEGGLGIPAVRRLTEDVSLIRPLLSVRRSEILSFLESLKQAYRVDSSNLTLGPTRNRLRHEAFPLLDAIMGLDTRRSLLGLAERLEPLVKRERDRFEQEMWAAGLTEPAEEIVVTRESWKAWDDATLVGVLRAAWRHRGWPERDMTAAWWKRVGERGGEAKVMNLPGNIRWSREGDTIRLQRES